MLSPVRTVAPASQIVTLAEAKLHLAVSNTDFDALIAGLISAATDHLDGYSGILGRALITQTWRQDFAGFSGCMRLPVGNLLSVSSVSYYDVDNSQQTLSTDVYSALSDAIGPLLVLNSGSSWPATYPRQDAVRVTWTAGYGPSASDVPAAIKQAILLLVGHWYANREAVSAGGSPAELPMGVTALIDPFRRKKI